jgi:hypothetical protein
VCNAPGSSLITFDGNLARFDGTRLGTLASRGIPSRYAEFLASAGSSESKPMPGTSVVRALQTGRPAQRLDVKESVGTGVGLQVTAQSPIGVALAPYSMSLW